MMTSLRDVGKTSICSRVKRDFIHRHVWIT